MGVRTPEQVIRVFYEMYGAAGVREQLFQVFSLLAVSERNGAPALEGRGEQVTRLFDQLVFLVDAIEKLRSGNSDANRCVICGRVVPDREM